MDASFVVELTYGYRWFHTMTILARQIPDSPFRPSSYFRVRPGEECDVTFAVSDNESQTPVDWSGRLPRFRIYSQHDDRKVVVEISEPERCSFGPDGIWHLRLTADETAMMPRGGMCFTLEYCDTTGKYTLGVKGGVSCCEDCSVDAKHSSPAITSPRRRGTNGR
jgi:hypothetical protein